jgi:molybdopterin-guanine dinucleotide biosynthesis protein A
MTISAALLAGGESRRMGRDKATILLRGKPLWQRQLELLGELDPAEILVSARADPAWRPNKCKFVADKTPSCGPLSGIAAALDQMESNHLLVLAIDLPFMTKRYLRLLCDQVEPGIGVLAKMDDRMEPLAAIYPQESAVDFQDALKGPDFSLQTVTKRLVEDGKLRALPVALEERELFRNLNEPRDLLDILTPSLANE